MADQKISELTALTGANVADDDAIAIVDTSATETKKIVFSELKNALDTATGFVRITGDTMTGNLSMGDNVKAIFGAGSDLQIYHSGGSSNIDDVGTGNFNITTNGAGIFFNKGGSENMASFVTDGAVTLYHNNIAKLATSSTGVDITGTLTSDGLTVDGNVGIGKAPTAALDVLAPSNQEPLILGVTTNSFGYATFRNAAGSDVGYFGLGGGAVVASGSVSDFAIRSQNNLLFSAGGSTELMRIRSDGSVGIGTSSNLLSGSNRTTVSINNTDSAAIAFGVNDTREGFIYSDASGLEISSASNLMRFTAGDSEKMHISSAGNVGIGVVPEAWNGLTALQINSQASVSADSSSIQLGANCYYNSGWKYINTAVATNYYQDSGAHVWRTAASGTADAAISWSEAMRISSDGSVGINDSSPDGKLNVVSTAHNNGSIFDSTGTTQLWLRDTDASSNQKNWGFQVSGGSLNILRANDDRASGFVTPIEIQQAPANSFVINSSGSVGIGTSSNLLSGSNRTTVSINNTDSAAIAFGVNGTREGFIYSDTSNLEISSASNFMKFTAGDSERMRILAGGGITFNGDTAAANALDDYEEGTWTPVSDYGTLTSVTATYTKIGNSVFIRLDCTMPSTSSSSIMAFAGLPFSTAQDGSAQMGVTTSSNYNPSILLQGTTCYFYGASAGAVAASTYSGSLVRFTGQYNTTS